jgi:hypothetical protein
VLLFEFLGFTYKLSTKRTPKTRNTAPSPLKNSGISQSIKKVWMCAFSGFNGS